MIAIHKYNIYSSHRARKKRGKNFNLMHPLQQDCVLCCRTTHTHETWLAHSCTWSIVCKWSQLRNGSDGLHFLHEKKSLLISNYKDTARLPLSPCISTPNCISLTNVAVYNYLEPTLLKSKSWHLFHQYIGSRIHHQNKNVTENSIGKSLKKADPPQIHLSKKLFRSRS